MFKSKSKCLAKQENRELSPGETTNRQVSISCDQQPISQMAEVRQQMENIM
jgi:hypothetical protein